MATTMVLNIGEQRLISNLKQAAKKLDKGQGDAVLDFSSVCRIDASALRALAELARAAEEKSVKVVLCGVNVDVYKVLKLVNLSSRFSFEN